MYISKRIEAIAIVEEYNTNNKWKTYLQHKVNDHLPPSF